jgi:hypothetical protein
MIGARELPNHSDLQPYNHAVAGQYVQAETPFRGRHDC